MNIASHLTKAFIESESSNKLKIALQKNTLSFISTCNISDEVFYKRNDSPEWKGPAKVLGQDKSVLFIRQGSRYIKAHLCQVQPVQMQESLLTCSNPIPNSSTLNFDSINSKNKKFDTKNGQINKNKQNNKYSFKSDKEEIINNNEEFKTESRSNHFNGESEDDSSNDDTHEQTSSPNLDTKQDSSAKKINL